MGFIQDNPSAASAGDMKSDNYRPSGGRFGH